MHPSYRNTVRPLFIWGFLLFFALGTGACVSQKKYSEKSAALSRLDSLYFIAQRQNHTLAAELEKLRSDTADCNNEVRELLDRFSHLNERNSEAIQKLKKENAALKKKLKGYKLTISRYTIDWRDLRNNMLLMDSVLATFGYRLDTLLQGSSMKYGLSRDLDELLLTIEKAELIGRPGRISAEADKTFSRIRELLKAFPRLEPVYYLNSDKDLRFVALINEYLNPSGKVLNIHISERSNPLKIGIGFRLIKEEQEQQR